jgi:hypothetical protein
VNPTSHGTSEPAAAALAGRKAKHPIAGPLSPLPFLEIELRRRGFVEEAVIAASPQPFRRCCPPATRTTRRLDDQPARLGVEFDLFGQIGFVEEPLGNPDPLRIADPDNSRLRRHSGHTVALRSRPPRSWRRSAPASLASRRAWRSRARPVARTRCPLLPCAYSGWQPARGSAQVRRPAVPPGRSSAVYRPSRGTAVWYPMR